MLPGQALCACHANGGPVATTLDMPPRITLTAFAAPRRLCADAATALVFSLHTRTFCAHTL